MARALIVTYASLFEPDDEDSLFFAKHGASRASRGTKGNLTLPSQRATSARVAAHLALQTAIDGEESPSSHFADAAFEATCPEWTKNIAESGTGSDGLAGHFWRRLAADCRAFDQSDQLLFGDLFPSVSHRPGADHEVGIWHQTKDRGMAHDSNWQFWVNWYDGFVSGKPLSLMRQSQVATIDDVTWKAGPAAVAEEIRRIERDFEERFQEEPPSEPASEVERALNTAILKAALTDFTVDQIARLMRMVPFAEDSRHLTGPELDAFLAEARAAIHRLHALRNLLSAGASPDSYELAIASLSDSLSDYLHDAEQVSELNIGLFVDLCSSLEFYYLNEDCLLSLGPKARFLSDTVTALQELVRDHFAPTLLRTRPLRDLALTEDDDSARLIGDLLSALDQVRSANAGHSLPLDAEGQAKLDQQMDELRRLQIAYSTTFDPALREQRRKDLGIKSAAFTVTLIRWQLIGQVATGSVWKGGKWIAETWDSAQNLRGAVDALLRLLGMK